MVVETRSQSKINGGFLVAAGSAGMAQAPSASPAQYSLLVGFHGTVRAGTLVHIEPFAGKQVLTSAPVKECQTPIFSSSDLEEGATYKVSLGGSAAGEVSDGLYQEGTYAPGTEYTRFTVSDVVTWMGGRRR